MNPETEYRDGLDSLASHYKDILQLLGEHRKRGPPEDSYEGG